jgi:hypothetical protein
MGIEFVPAICPNCNGELRVPNDKSVVKCMYCGVDIVLNQTIKDEFDYKKITELAWKEMAAGNYNQVIYYSSRILENDPNSFTGWMLKSFASFYGGCGQDPWFHEGLTYLNNCLIAPSTWSKDDTCIYFVKSFKGEYKNFDWLLDFNIKFLPEVWRINPSLSVAEIILMVVAGYKKSYLDFEKSIMDADYADVAIKLFIEGGVRKSNYQLEKLIELEHLIEEKYPNLINFENQMQELLNKDPVLKRCYCDELNSRIIEEGIDEWIYKNNLNGCYPEYVRKKYYEFDPKRSLYTWIIRIPYGKYPRFEVFILYNNAEDPVGINCVREGFTAIQCLFNKTQLKDSLQFLYALTTNSKD